MCKKASLGVLALLVVGGLLFGGKVIPYAKTAFNKAKHAAESQVPISFQLDAAKEQLKKIDPEIKDMVWQIAKEKADVKRLASDLERQSESLEAGKQQMMTLREHLNSGEQAYVATNGKAYTNTRVREDLAHRLAVFKTAQKTVEKTEQVLELRKQALESALAKLDEAQAQQRELEVRIENLTARQRMVEVAQTASQINIDNSELARTRQMIDDISAKIDTQEEMLNLAPKYFGQIPVGDESIIESDRDVVQEFDEYFNQVEDSSLTQK